MHNITTKILYDTLDICQMSLCNIDLLLANSSTKQALGRVKNVMIELHMSFFHVDFIIMDIKSRPATPLE
jgi:hypothetical protein